jgi:hypothetical protein
MKNRSIKIGPLNAHKSDVKAFIELPKRLYHGSEFYVPMFDIDMRGCDAVVGPMLTGGASGAGILVEGFEQQPAMTMMRYNYPYYRTLLESYGFKKYVDLHSFSVPPEHFVLPERISRLAEAFKIHRLYKMDL